MTASDFPSHCMGPNRPDHPEKVKPKAGEMEGFFFPGQEGALLDMVSRKAWEKCQD